MSPPTSATPTIASSRPRQPPINPLTVDPSPSEAISVSPKTASQKYSTGPNFSATVAIGGASSSRKPAPTSPPATDARQASVSARSPRPARAIG